MMHKDKKSLLSRKLIMGTTIGAALFFMVAGIIFWGGFNTAMEATNTMEFCISCHEMEENVYTEYKETIHYSNRSGVRAACSDCHVPDPWVHKFVRKIEASNELFHKIIGSVDTPEKFNEKRLYLAQRVWKTMKQTDSRECRNCHDFASMKPDNQKPRARKQHMNAMEKGNTCIDCHKGIAHKKVHSDLTEDELNKIEKPVPEHIRPIPEAWKNFDASRQQEEVNTNVDEKTVTPVTVVATAETPKVEVEKAPALEVPADKPVAKTAVASGRNWSKVPSRNVVLFYPGQSSMEWVLTGSDHGGARPFKAGDRCFDCHDEEAKEIGRKIVTGEKLEPNPIKGKRGSIPVTVQAAHDKTHLYMRFQWKDTAHVPVPSVTGGKMDPENQVKLAVMFATDEVEYADRAGCWGTCHHDLRSMPDEPQAQKDKISKYISESRSELELKGGDGKSRGGWDKLKPQAEIDEEMKAGHYMDIIRYNSGTKKSENGHVLSERKMSGGDAVEFIADNSNGTWTVEMKRKLSTGKPGDVDISKGQQVNFGFAIHDDYSSARYHHVSVGYKLGIDDPEAEINAVSQ